MILYRSGLVTAATSFVAAASAAFLPDNLRGLIEQNLDLLYVIGGGGLGLSLVLIHIYVTEIKRTLQALWALGVVGSAVTYTSLAAPSGQGLVQYIVDNPTAIWFVGPLFAALTGLVFKEGKKCAAIPTYVVIASSMIVLSSNFHSYLLCLLWLFRIRIPSFFHYISMNFFLKHYENRYLLWKA